MNKSEENDYLSLTHFFSKALFLGIGISNILVKVKESAIFSLILGSFFGTIILYFLNKLHYNDANKFKKAIMFFIIYLLFLIGIAEYVNLISSIYLIDTNKFFIILPLIVVILYINSKELNINYKVSALLLVLYFLIFGISSVALVTVVKPLNYLPLFNVSFKRIILSAFEFALYSVTPNILYGGLKNDIKDVNKKIIKKYLLSCISISLIVLLTQGVLGIELVKLFKYPEYVILKKINLLNFINNIENILSFFWLFIIFIYLSISSKQLYNISLEFFHKKSIYPIFIIVSLFFITKYVFDNANCLYFLYKNLWIMCLGILVIYILININTLNKKKKE